LAGSTHSATDNIWAPDSGPTSLTRGSSKYTFYNTTAWDVIQEMTLRHPGFIASIIPYEDYWGPRVTLFFGSPEQLCAVRDPSPTEQNIQVKMKELIKVEDDSQAKEKAIKALMSSSKKPNPNTLDNIRKDLTRDEQVIKRLRQEIGQDQGWIKPFRSYHIATSSMHIIANGIKNSAHNTFNVATVLFENKEPEASKATNELNFQDMQNFTLAADVTLEDEEKREVVVRYPNCIGDEMAKFYGVSTLFNTLKDAYRGHLVLVGNPKIKPYDIIYIF
jgi:hypothetical protein